MAFNYPAKKKAAISGGSGNDRFRIDLLKEKAKDLSIELYAIVYARRRRISQKAENKSAKMRRSAMYQDAPKNAKKRHSTLAASKLSMIDDEMAVNEQMLNSWKEVAVYLGRGVRTVQRWEIDLGLPVRRPRGKPRSAVIALKAELDSWLTGSQKETSKEIIKKTSVAERRPLVGPQARSLHANTEILVSKTKKVLERSYDLCNRSRDLCEQLNRAIELTRQTRSEKNAPTSVESTKVGARKIAPPPA